MSCDTVESNRISKFFENKSVFITGATGFIGRLLVEKLLRSCSGINKIYVLMRPRRDGNLKDRIHDIIDIPIFDSIRQQNIKALDKIILIAGNIAEINLGMSAEDRKTIIDNVSIIFHVAASVRFDDHLKKSILTNARSTREIATLATQLKKIDVFVHTSTAYSNCDKSEVEEKVYPPKVPWEDLIRIAEEGDDSTLQYITQKFVYPMPNTYTFTKAIGENAAIDICKGKVPLVIARPTIVKPTFIDPFPSWVDNMNGSIALTYGIGAGAIRVIYGDPYNVYDNVFADNVVKALIISACRQASSNDTQTAFVCNIASDISCHTKEEERFGPNYVMENPIRQTLFHPWAILTVNYYLYFFLMIIEHLIPALIVDTCLRFMNHKPLAKFSLWSIQKKTFIANTTLIYFMRNSWDFKNENYLQLRDSLNEEEKKDFFIHYFGKNPTREEIIHFIKLYYDGARKYIGHEPDATPEFVRSYKRKQFIKTIILRILLVLFLYYLIFKYQILHIIGNRICNYFERI